MMMQLYSYKNAKRNETIWLKIRIRTVLDLYIGCGYIPTQGNVKHICTDIFDLLEECIPCSSQKGELCCRGISMMQTI